MFNNRCVKVGHLLEKNHGEALDCLHLHLINFCQVFHSHLMLGSLIFSKQLNYDPSLIIVFAGLNCRRSAQATASRGCKLKHPCVERLCVLHKYLFHFSLTLLTSDCGASNSWLAI